MRHLAALLLFVILGAKVSPVRSAPRYKDPATNALVAAFLLNIAIVLFGYRRARDLAETLQTRNRRKPMPTSMPTPITQPAYQPRPSCVRSRACSRGRTWRRADAAGRGQLQAG